MTRSTSYMRYTATQYHAIEGYRSWLYNKEASSYGEDKLGIGL